MGRGRPSRENENLSQDLLFHARAGADAGGDREREGGGGREGAKMKDKERTGERGQRASERARNKLGKLSPSARPAVVPP